MSPYFALLLLLFVTTATAGKYVYYPRLGNWFEAQQYCRQFHTDLAPIDSQYDMSLIRKLAPKHFAWIGLLNSSNSSSGWMWSGGTEVSADKSFWLPGKPNNIPGENNGAISSYNAKYLWYDAKGSISLHFLCYGVHAVREKRTWYEALDYCRQNHQDLASVASETEMMLIKTELKKQPSSYNVWTGMHFMDSDWLWMDGQPFTYESWGPDPKPTCPDINNACGAIRVRGPAQQVEQEKLIDVDRVLGWNVLDCNKKLHFLCY